MLLRCPEPGRYEMPNGESLSPGQLAAYTTADLVLVLPAQHCHLGSINVAQHEVRHLARTLPWKLEEHLIDPVEALHVAFTPVRALRSDITAVNKQYLQSVLQDAHAKNLKPTLVISEAELVPWKELSWSVFFAKGAKHCLLRHGSHQALVCTPVNLKLVLQTLAAEQASLPQAINLYCQPDKVELLSAQVPAAMQSLLQVKQPVWLKPEEATCCNLLQGEFAAPLPWQQWWKQWRMAAVLLLALLLGDLALTGLRSYQLQSELTDMQAALENEVQRAMPGAALVDPLLQLRRAVRDSGGETSGGFLVLLNRMTPVLAASKDTQVQSMDYNADSGELQLMIETGSFSTVETLRAGLQALGLTAELLGSSSDGARSRSRLKVKA